MRSYPSFRSAVRLLVFPALSACLSATEADTSGDPNVYTNDGIFDFTVTGAVSDHVGARYAIWDSVGGNGLSGPGIDLGNIASGTVTQPIKPKAVYFLPVLGGSPDSLFNRSFRAGATTSLQKLPDGNPNFIFRYDDGPANTTWTATDGQFTITAFTPPHLKGSFSFHATAVGHTGQITVSGTFDAVNDPGVPDTVTASTIPSFARRRPRATAPHGG